jgi:ribonuclease HI
MTKKTKNELERVTIYSDGSIRGNPGGLGGYAAIVLRDGAKNDCIHGHEFDTTNNRMELRAAIVGLMSLDEPHMVTMVTDSQYLSKGMTQWLKGWKRKDWKNSNGKPVANRDLWQTLDRLCQYHRVRWEWVRGHDGNLWNEEADKLAGHAADVALGDASSN